MVEVEERVEATTSDPKSGRVSRSSRVRQVVAELARDIAVVMSAGDVAELRRMRPGDPACPAFWKLLTARIEPALGLPAGGRRRLELERRWSVILAALATLDGLHAPGRPLGRALAEAGLTELRLNRLLVARSEGLHDALRTVCHQLSSTAQPADLAELALLVLSEGERDEELVRRAVARHYFRQR